MSYRADVDSLFMQTPRAEYVLFPSPNAPSVSPRDASTWNKSRRAHTIELGHSGLGTVSRECYTIKTYRQSSPSRTRQYTPREAPKPSRCCHCHSSCW